MRDASPPRLTQPPRPGAKLMSGGSFGAASAVEMITSFNGDVGGKSYLEVHRYYLDYLARPLRKFNLVTKKRACHKSGHAIILAAAWL
jgi:hypothetical protein